MSRIHFNLDKVFEISILLKSLDAIAELIGGTLLLVISPNFINRLTNDLTQHTLSKHPQVYWAREVAHLGHDLAHNSRLFGGLYLLLHGVVKLVVIIGVLKQKLWAYPWLIVVISAFLIYQVWDLLHKFSYGLLLLSAFDIFIIVLTYLEWQRHKQRPKPTVALKPSSV